MASREDLHTLLVEILGSPNVYYQAPGESMVYPCIKYSKTKRESTYANDAKYSNTNCYEIIVIDRMPDNLIIDKLLELPYCSYDRHYKADNLNHDVLILYY